MKVKLNAAARLAAATPKSKAQKPKSKPAKPEPKTPNTKRGQDKWLRLQKERTD